MRRDRSWRVMGALVAVFALPLAASWWLVNHPGGLPGSRVNHGTPIEPPVPTGIRGGWTLAVPEGKKCGDRCSRLRSVALIVQRALVPELRQATVLADCAASRECAALGEALGGEALLVVVDPTGNAMLRYGPEVSPRDLLHDLQRLLKRSGY